MSLTILAVYAHPDDGEFHAAGALARWAAEGHRVIAVCATDGALGTFRRDVTAAHVHAERTKELTAALATLGGQAPIMLGYPDGFLSEHAAELRERLVYLYRSLQPDRVLTFDPFKHYEIHPDHITVGRMATEAAVFSCFPLLYPRHLKKGLTPHQPAEVWFMGPLEHRPNRVVDISMSLDKKVDATLCHSSQIEMLAKWFLPGADPTALTPEQKGQLRGATRGFLSGMAEGMAKASQGKLTHAECFYAQKTGPGHLDNNRQMMMEMLGAPPEPPEIG